nr:MAG TPA: hypothetical protein [Caudoviricetes sp.]
MFVGYWIGFISVIARSLYIQRSSLSSFRKNIEYPPVFQS